MLFVLPKVFPDYRFFVFSADVEFFDFTHITGRNDGDYITLFVPKYGCWLLRKGVPYMSAVGL